MKTSKAIQAIVDSVSYPHNQLWYEIDEANDQVVITTYADYVAHNTEVREYDSRDLKLTREWDPTFFDDVSKLIIETVASDSWITTVGMPGAIHVVDGRLFITQTRENHRQIENLMAQLRETEADSQHAHGPANTPATP